MTKKKFTIPYQYTIIAHATVYADSLEEAVDLVESDGWVEEPDDLRNGDYVNGNAGIHKTNFSYLENSFEIHHDDLDLYGNPV